MFEQALKDVGNFWRLFAGFHMSSDEFKDCCREAWKVEENRSFFIIRLKETVNVSFVFVLKRNKVCLKCIPETNPF